MMSNAYFDIPPSIEQEIRADERRKCWEEVSSMIRPGDLGGSGWDKNAERNGLILAASRILNDRC